MLMDCLIHFSLIHFEMKEIFGEGDLRCYCFYAVNKTTELPVFHCSEFVVEYQRFAINLPEIEMRTK